MSPLQKENKETIIQNLIDRCADQKDQNLWSSFIQLTLEHTASNDLCVGDLDVLYEKMMLWFQLFVEARETNYVVKALNPDSDTEELGAGSSWVLLVFDDMPFVVDSVRNVLKRMGCYIEFCVNRAGLSVTRDQQGRVVSLTDGEVQAQPSKDHTTNEEACLLIEINRQVAEEDLRRIEEEIAGVMADVRAAVNDWSRMRDRLKEAVATLVDNPSWSQSNFIGEKINFLKWLHESFTFIGYRKVKLVHDANDDSQKTHLEMEVDSGLGVLSKHTDLGRKYGNLPEHTIAVLTSTKTPLIISKTSKKSTIHRDVYTDYIAVKILDDQGRVSGMHQFVGLLTSDAYDSDPSKIPLLETKLRRVIDSDLQDLKGYTKKRLLRILRNLPREELFQSSVKNLKRMVYGIFAIHGRREMKLFMRLDTMQRFVSFVLVLPRDNWNTRTRVRVEDYLMQVCQGIDYGLTPLFDGYDLVYVHVVVRVNPAQPVDLQEHAVEQVVRELVKTWEDRFIDAVTEQYGYSHVYRILKRYQQAFPAGYQAAYDASEAVSDIDYIQEAVETRRVALRLFTRPSGPAHQFHLKIFECDHFPQLSEIMPVLENMGLRVIEDANHMICFEGDEKIAVSDFALTPRCENVLNLSEVRARFLDAFLAIRNGHAEDDALNALTLTARLRWRDVTLLRAYIRHARQCGFQLTDGYIHDVLCRYPQIARQLVSLFHHRFDPDLDHDNLWQKQDKRLEVEMTALMATVKTLDEDRIFRRLRLAIAATLRTNYYQRDVQGQPKPVITLKFASEELPDLPLPHPKIEAWVYSPSVEGIHLRADLVARGGFRWSDRRDDFRTEILGLMKAQKVKNALIVPTGAKGGFFTKRVTAEMTREDMRAEGVACYQSFIHGLLDITDNVDNGQIIKPERTLCYDGDDHYLVVAADKGTATFSDYANAISVERGFWLKDAFASGGSNGYDHKAMGITARGAWEAVIHHFRAMGMDPAKDEFTVAGIGGMNGDVFGNGMLLSDKIKLVAAFNADWIFIDPDPQVDVSFRERQRLFEAQNLDWSDYNTSLISKGGGVFSRADKHIKLSAEIKNLLGVESDELDPSEVIKAILCLDIDLLWNGGIGTYVKASSERHEDVQDKSNDAVRVDACDLRVKVIGEGGNLGVTQLARVEFSQHGGYINTDFVDNSAGVDCSDHEVNLKILLNQMVEDGQMDESERNTLLAELTDGVAALVLRNNRIQNQLLSMMVHLTSGHYRLYTGYIHHLTKNGILNPAVEFLPTDKQIEMRLGSNKTYERPELAVLMGYSKLVTKSAVMAAEGFDDPIFEDYLFRAFPKKVVELYSDRIRQHVLRDRIIANELTNQFISELGVGFVELVQAEIPASLVDIFKAYLMVRRLFDVPHFVEIVENELTDIDNAIHVDLMLILRSLLRKSIRWLLRNHSVNGSTAIDPDRYGERLRAISSVMRNHLDATKLRRYQQTRERLLACCCSEASADFIASLTYVGNALNVIESMELADAEIDEYVDFYYHFESEFSLGWLRYQVSDVKVGEDHWQVIANATLRGQLEIYHRELTAKVYRSMPSGYWGTGDSCHALVADWLTNANDFVRRWVSVVKEIQGMQVCSFEMLVVAIYELAQLDQLLTTAPT